MSLRDKTEQAPKTGCARRDQVLDAAEKCFCEQGFHGTSIATISKSAGMSAGHIYHYFENKETIIAAIVEREVSSVLKEMNELQNQPDLKQALMDCVTPKVYAHLDTKRAALMVEVLAESVRNERIAKVFREKDEASIAKLHELLQQVRGELPPLTESELNGRVEVMAALFNGLRLRSLCNPQLDREALLAELRPVLERLIAG